MTQLSDADARRIALTKLDTTILVEAAAGTGKTALVAGRVVMILARGVDPARIAAITFTESAARELSSRVHKYISDLIQGVVPVPLRLALPEGLSEAHRSALVAAFGRLDQLTSTTIHGFCQRLISSFAIESNIDPGATILDGDQQYFVQDDIIGRWLKRRLSEKTHDEDPIAIIARELPRDAVKEIRSLARFRLAYRRANVPPSPLQLGAEEGFSRAVSAFRSWLDSQPRNSRAEDIFATYSDLATHFQGRCSDPTFSDLWQLTHPPQLPGMRDKSRDLETPRIKSSWDQTAGRERGRELNDTMLKLCAEVRVCYRTLMGSLSSALLSLLSKELDEILDEYSTFKRNAAVLDFDDLLEKARDLIRNSPQARIKIGERFTHIVVDEFQDTDPVQCEILFGIAGDGDIGSWQDLALRPGALFMVGDPKQAIYRFRGANIDTYSAAKHSINTKSSGQVLTLKSSFRSRPAILSYVNDCFEAELNADGQPGYVPLSPTLAASASSLPAVSRIPVVLQGNAQAKKVRMAEAVAVANICQALLSSEDVLEEEGQARAVAPGDIALLARTHTDLWIYERELESRGLPFASTAGKNLYRRQEAQDFLALARVLADPFDLIAFGAFMRGPFVGLRDKDLLAITSALPNVDGKEARFSVLTPPEHVKHPIAARVLQILQNLRNRSRSRPPALLLADAAEQLLLHPILASRDGAAAVRSTANLEALIERARQYDVRGIRAFARDLSREWSSVMLKSEGRVDVDGQSITIVTMHGAKGLEWPIIIPINLGGSRPPRSSLIHRPSDNSIHWIFSDVVAPGLEAAIVEDDAAELREHKRLLYVACTRAQELLIIPDLKQAGAGSKSWSRMLDLKPNSLPTLALPSSVPKTRPRVVGRNGQTLDRFEAEAALLSEVSVPLQWKRASDRDKDRIPVTQIAVSDEGAPEAVAPVGAGRVRGLVLHKMIEEILTGELEETTANLISRAQELIEQLQLDLERGAHLPDASEMTTTVMRALSLPEIVDLRSYLVAELPVYSALGEDRARSALAGRIDAAAIKDDKPVALIDWKSDVAPTANEIAAHCVQMEDYLRATRCPRGALVYLTSSKIHWIVLEDSTL